MINAVVDHAVANVWCTPGQDDQYIFKPARLTPRQGVRHHIDIEWDTVYVPDKEHDWHIFMVGQLSPHYLNLLQKERQWYCATTLCLDHSLLVDAYAIDGRQFPRYHVYFRKTHTRNLLVAVRHHTRLPDLEYHDLYLRFYYNAFFSSVRAKGVDHKVIVEGKEITRRSDVVKIQRDLREKYRPLVGHVYTFVNGWVVNEPHPDFVEVGDCVEVVYDSTIKEVVDLPIRDLAVFTSTLDDDYKYILSRKKATDPGFIDYQDDIDVWLIDHHRLTGIKGVYFHKNDPGAFRQLTHLDYSLSSNRAAAFVNGLREWNDLTALTVRLHIRQAGYERPLIYESGRIHELYRMNDFHVYKAMAGTDATVSVWQADALEKAGYTEVMRSRDDEITPELVQKAYGYHGMSKVLADTPSPVEVINSARQVPLGYGLAGGCTVFEYDRDGFLIDWHHHLSGSIYFPRSSACVQIEAMIGYGSKQLETYYGYLDTPLQKDRNYRFYLSSAIAGVTSNDWAEIPVTDDAIDICDGTLYWCSDEATQAPAVRSDHQFLLYRDTVRFTQGHLKFNIEAEEFVIDQWMTIQTRIPLGQVNVFLNNHLLIEGLDYIVTWPQVFIVNKEYLVPGEVQDIIVRCHGFCQSDMTPEPPAEVGFVEHGLLSRNSRYDLRDDKVTRFIVDGALKSASEIRFTENSNQGFVDHVRNGAPYQLSDVMVPIAGLVNADPYEMRQDSLAVDREIEDYLTLVLPEKTIPGPSIIGYRHTLYSPFISAIHEDIIFGNLDISALPLRYNGMQLREWLKPYEWLLAYDPAFQGHDPYYVLVQAHRFLGVSDLTILEYNFLQQTIDQYFPDVIDLSHAARIK